MNRGMIPAEPIRRVVEGWLEKEERQHDRHGHLVARAAAGAKKMNENLGHHVEFNQDTTLPTTPRQKFLFEVWGQEDDKDSTEARNLVRLLDRREGYREYVYPERTRGGKPRKKRQTFKQEWIGFDTADKILCGLRLVHLWHFDPELNAIYQNVELPDAR